MRIKGYSINENELLKIKGIFVRARKGEAISENEAKYCLKIAKHIASFFKESEIEIGSNTEKEEEDLDVNINILLSQELKK